MGTLVKRPEIMAFLDKTPNSSYTWKRIGNGMTTGSYSYEASETSETYIVDDNATTTIDSYTLSFDGEMKCIFGDDVYDYINGLRYNLATGSDATSHLLLVDKYDEITASSGKFRAQLFDCSISISSYGGDGGATPTISFKISANGTPKKGYATISSGTPTFHEGFSA